MSKKSKRIPNRAEHVYNSVQPVYIHMYNLVHVLTLKEVKEHDIHKVETFV